MTDIPKKKPLGEDVILDPTFKFVMSQPYFRREIVHAFREELGLDHIESIRELNTETITQKYNGKVGRMDGVFLINESTIAIFESQRYADKDFFKRLSFYISSVYTSQGTVGSYDSFKSVAIVSFVNYEVHGKEDAMIINRPTHAYKVGEEMDYLRTITVDLTKAFRYLKQGSTTLKDAKWHIIAFFKNAPMYRKDLDAF